jgi:hypothetical protein
MTDSHRIARDLLAAMTDDEAAAFVTEARTPQNDRLNPGDLFAEFLASHFEADRAAQASPWAQTPQT